MNNTYLSHHGIKGQKWGVRRFQYPDGSLTSTGRKKQNKDIYKGDKNILSTNKKKSGLKVAGGILAGIGAFVAIDYVLSKTTGNYNLIDAGKLAIASMKLKG